MRSGYYPSPCELQLSRLVGALLITLANALSNTEAEAACGPLASGTYAVSQTCIPAAGVEAVTTAGPATTVTTTAGSSILCRGNNANSSLTLDGTTVNSTPPTAANAVFSNRIGAGGASDASLNIIGASNTVSVSGSGLDPLAITKDCSRDGGASNEAARGGRDWRVVMRRVPLVSREWRPGSRGEGGECCRLNLLSLSFKSTFLQSI
jgi:hypothetical protein